MDASMTSVILIGSGPAAAGAAIALSSLPGVEIACIDIGLGLDSEHQQVIERLAASEPDRWDPALVEHISTQPVPSGARGVPEKRSYGSDYPFRDVGQLEGLTASHDVTTSLVSAAYGGFSTVWGSQLMPYASSAFDTWPFDAAVMRPHYQAVLDVVPYAAERDDLADSFPLLHRSEPLPRLSERSRRVLGAYARHRRVLNSNGITIGKARLAVDARACARCGLCMTGCPYGLVYSAAQTFEALRRAGRVTMHGGLMALRVSEGARGASVVAQELATGRRHTFEADRIFVACGAIGTTRLIANSLRLFDVDLPLLESQQFALPVLSIRACADPRHERDFTLNQFNVLVAPNEDSADLAQLHFYTFNPAFVDALPAPLRGERMEWAQVQLLRRLSVALGYLPSWRSPRLSARIRPTADDRRLPEMHVSRGDAPSGRGQMLRSVASRLVRAAPLLDLYPLLPMLRLAAGGKSYHWGGSFPHTARRSTAVASDRIGRVGPWDRVHLVDASVFPTIPAMTFALTIMANAHRIVSEAMGQAQ
jgi:ferredoxin